MSFAGRGKGALVFSRTPGAPTGVTAIARDASAIVSFVAPAPNGGPPITGYEVTASPGGVTAIGGASPITITGLTNGTVYTFTVKAINFYGRGGASGASGAVTPHTDSKTVSFPGEGPLHANGSDDIVTFNTVNADWFTPTGLAPTNQHISVPANGTYRVQASINYPDGSVPFGHGWSGTAGNKETWMNISRGGSTWVYPVSGSGRLGLTSNWFGEPFSQGVDQTLALLAGDEIVIFGNHGATGNGMRQWDASMTITKQ